MRSSFRSLRGLLGAPVGALGWFFATLARVLRRTTVMEFPFGKAPFWILVLA